MERIRIWLFPIVLALAWLTGFAYVLARLGEVHATLVVARLQQQRPEGEQPASDAQQLARR